MTVAPSSELSAALSRLGLESENSGAFDGTWIPTHGKRYESVNPATGEVLGVVREVSAQDYERVAAATARWRRSEIDTRFGKRAEARHGDPDQHDERPQDQHRARREDVRRHMAPPLVMSRRC